MATTPTTPGVSIGGTSGDLAAFLVPAGTKVSSGSEQSAEVEAEEVDIEGEGDESAPEAEAAPAADDKAEAKPDQEVETDDLDSLIQQFAKEHGLDLNDKNQRKIAKRLADKELYIRQLKGATTAPPKESGPDHLAQFVQGLTGQADDKQPKPAAEKTTPAADKPAAAEPAATPFGDAPPFVAMVRGWKSRTEPYEQLNEGYRDGDLTKVANVEDGLYFSRTLQIALPLVERLVEQRISSLMEKELADVIPSARQLAQEKADEEDREYAVAALSKIDEFRDIVPKLFEVDEGDDIEFRGRKFDNTPINKIFVEHPELLEIRHQDSDRRKANKMSFFSRYMAAAKIFRDRQKAALSPDQTKKLVEAGANMERRERDQGRVRQTLNSGGGATGLGTGGKKEPSWTERVLSAGGDTSVRSLFR